MHIYHYMKHSRVRIINKANWLSLAVFCCKCNKRSERVVQNAQTLYLKHMFFLRTRGGAKPKLATQVDH